MQSIRDLIEATVGINIMLFLDNFYFIGHGRSARGHAGWRQGLLTGAAFITITAAGAGPATAQERGAAHIARDVQVAQAGEARAFEIAAQPLASALDQFSQQTGISFASATSQLSGVQSPGVKGTFTSQQALERLLEGTGVTFRFAGPASVTLEKLPQTGGGVIQLGPVRVEDAAQRDAAQTEGTGSYTTPMTATSTRLGLSLRETPQSITVVTRQRMDDLAIVSPRDLLMNTPGITSTATAPYRETFYARGFAVENYSFDGLTLSSNSSRRGAFLNDMAMLDHVEIVRGSTGLLQGAGTPSAAINFARKRPTRVFQAQFQGDVGSWNNYSLQADVGGPLNDSGTLRARGVARWSDADSFMDVATEKRQLYYFIGEADLAPALAVTLGVSHQVNGNTTGYGGLPTARDGSSLGLPRSTFLGNKWNRWDDTTTTLFGDITYRFSDDWTAKVAFNQIWGDQHQLRSSPSWSEALGYSQSLGNARLDSGRGSYEASVQGAFDLLGRKHELVFGANARIADEDQMTAGYYTIRGATNMDIYNWNHDFPEPAVWEDDYLQNSKEKQGGIFGTARLSVLESLKVIVGGRVDWFKTENFQRVRNVGATTFNPMTTSGYNYDGHLTKYAGIVYDLTDQYSMYVSYSDIFKAQSQRDINNDFLPPVIGENYEAGVKAEWFSGNLNASASIYQLNQANLAMSVGACPFNPLQTCYAATGLARSKGYDLEVQGAITPDWQVSVGYTHVVTKVVRDANPARVGLRLNTQLPTNQFKVSSSYRFYQWRVGGNLRWQSRIYYSGTTPAPAIAYHSEQPGHAIVDAMAGYALNDNIDFQVNVNNVFDKVYFSAINAQPVEWGGNTVYGAPRSFRATAKYKF